MNNDETNRLPVDFGAGPEDKEHMLRVSIAIDNGRVILAFGQTVGFIGFSPSQARMIAVKMIEAAEKC